VKHLFEQFHNPKANLLHIGIELLHPNNMEYRREFRDSVSVVYYDFLDQVNDLLNNISICSDEFNFDGTVDLKIYFPMIVFEIMDLLMRSMMDNGFMKQMRNVNVLLRMIFILFCQWLDILTRLAQMSIKDKLEPFLFTLTILNHQCRHCSNAWSVLGFMPDLEHKSSAAIVHGRSGLTGKGRMAHSYHHCLAIIL